MFFVVVVVVVADVVVVAAAGCSRYVVIVSNNGLNRAMASPQIGSARTICNYYLSHSIARINGHSLHRVLRVLRAEC